MIQDMTPPKTFVEPKPDVVIQGLRFWNPSYEDFAEWFYSVTASSTRDSHLVGLVNAHTFNQAANDREFRNALQQAKTLVNDGIGYRIASKMRGVETRYNLNGTDLIPRLLEEAPREVSLFLYGATEESNAGAARALAETYPQARIAGRIHGFVDPEAAVEAVAASGADVLLVALGHPRQELFCVRHRNRLHVKVAFPVGGLFDFLSGTKPRAPQWVRAANMEWLYRMAIEPRRMFKRYVLGNPVFLARSLVWRGRDRSAIAALQAPKNASRGE
jgi:N-acetylglucosaminyldiphosphoundecaprenol N-acetyl-beta-D-mannosaminyltransferase